MHRYQVKIPPSPLQLIALSRLGTPYISPSFLLLPCTCFLLKAFFIGLVLVITIIGNTLVLVSFATTRKLQTYTNYYLVGLAVADLVSGGVTPALLNVTFMIGYWPFGPVICRVFIYLNTVFVHATFLLTFIICVDRYRAMSRPLKHLKEKTRNHALKMILPGFLVPSLLWAVVILILPECGVFTPLPPYACHIPYASNKIVLLISSLFISWVPIIGTSILYACIYFGIIRKRPARRSTSLKERNSASVVESDPGSVPDLPKERELVDGDGDCKAREKGENTDEDTCTCNTIVIECLWFLCW
ncbi:muscarinic acetylcholine receptor M2-like [Patiria miniata]|uniref:G-protein coupled receptors family 1 profile domain-containing protein n=1 Tax=Patiria miniata TaxID=46514 RepID=A0A913ZMZ7_PATMI|nr:muscarinic acetylcholine receptor M2-like [Patiria miniata]